MNIENKDKFKFQHLCEGAQRGELYLVDLGEAGKVLARVTSEGSWAMARLLSDDEIAALPIPNEETEAIQFTPVARAPEEEDGA